MDTSKDVVAKKSFNERMKDRIKDSIGELMTDKELSEIVHRAMEEIFFKPMVIKDGYHSKEAPPFIHQLLKELLTDEVRVAVSEYIGENKEVVLTNIQQVISLGMGKALMDAVSFSFQNDLIVLENNIRQNILSR